MTGTWAAISMFLDKARDTNCAGLRRGPVFESVFIADGYSLESHVVGTWPQSPTMEPDGRGSLIFPFDFGGDSHPVFRCRLTTRRTLACVIDVYQQWFEFKRMSVRPDEIVKASP
jgi:hypothetical protein